MTLCVGGEEEVVMHFCFYEVMKFFTKRSNVQIRCRIKGRWEGGRGGRVDEWSYCHNCASLIDYFARVCKELCVGVYNVVCECGLVISL